MRVTGIIPARYQATRLPGKPLLKIGDHTLIQHVYLNAKKCRWLDEIIVATDDERILQSVEAVGGTAVLTPSELPSGTDRCAQVARDLETDIVANIQGDEPFLDPAVIDAAVDRVRQEPPISVCTVVRQPIRATELDDPNVVKVIINNRGEALYFSRQHIPYRRSREELAPPVYAHIGLYVYRKSYLMHFVGLPVSPLERYEQLEQLRMLENGDKINVIVTDKESLGIDTPQDVKQAERIIAHHED